MNLPQKIYFIGIGGIGMSALARYFRSRGAEVWGYDRTETPLTKALEQEGMHIHYREDISLIPEGLDMAVYTPAIPAEHQELVYFREHGYKLLKRSELLGLVSRDSRAIAIAGTHGKTTTSSMLTAILRKGGVDCTAFLGGIALDFNSNYIGGASDWVVAEADEYDKSFLQLQPQMAAILSMDADHLDIYGDADQMQQQGYLAFARQLKPGGMLFVRHDLKAHFGAFPHARYYGVEAGTYRSTIHGVQQGKMLFDYQSPETHIAGLELALPGRHNVENATVAIALALEAGVGEEAIREALSGFKGIKRRFERIVETEQIAYIDDYAHHPAELRAAIEAARTLFPGKRLTGIFQPHLYSRTRDFQEGFAQALDMLDEPWLLPIYPAREKPIAGVDSEMILRLMKNPAKRLMGMDEVIGNLEKYPPQVLMTLGAGDIDTLVEPIKNWLTDQLQ
jgi:UDP-N-acetylmuramate--alanine ligase